MTLEITPGFPRRDKETQLFQETKELTDGKIEETAREFGLDFPPAVFEVVPPRIMYELAAYGLPGRFPHWTHGRDYYRMKSSYDFGLSKIYELVINTDPSYAFIMDTNDFIQNTLVKAHVLAHVDFFKHNPAFKDSDRSMVQVANAHAERVRGYMFKHGAVEVEKCLDAVLAIQNCIDANKRSYDRTTDKNEYLGLNQESWEQKQRKKKTTTPYDDLFTMGEKRSEDPSLGLAPVPSEPEQDLLYFLAVNSTVLKDWQKDLLLIVRNEMQYFIPQIKTKIMNEGWAAFWHLRILRKLGDERYLSDGEVIEFSRLHAGVVAISRQQLNPYCVGLEVWENIDRRFHGLAPAKGEKEKDWDGEIVDPESFKDKLEYDKFWIRETIGSDGEFLRLYLTPNLIKNLDLYVYRLEGDKWIVVEKDPVKVREMIIGSLTNFGDPVIKVAAGGCDYNGRGELYLEHAFEGLELDFRWAEKTLGYIYQLWGKPVHLETMHDGKKILLLCSSEKEVGIVK